MTQDVLSTKGHTLAVHMEKDDEREVNTTCDSTFMEDIMPEVGKAIREKYYWVSRDFPILLFPDNAGDYGIKEAVTKYLAMLNDDFNVVYIHQRPHLPAINRPVGVNSKHVYSIQSVFMLSNVSPR
jgi:hypothetical protein